MTLHGDPRTPLGTGADMTHDETQPQPLNLSSSFAPLDLEQLLGSVMPAAPVPPQDSWAAGPPALSDSWAAVPPTAPVADDAWAAAPISAPAPQDSWAAAANSAPAQVAASSGWSDAEWVPAVAWDAEPAVAPAPQPVPSWTPEPDTEPSWTAMAADGVPPMAQIPAHVPAPAAPADSAWYAEVPAEVAPADATWYADVPAQPGPVDAEWGAEAPAPAAETVVLSSDEYATLVWQAQQYATAVSAEAAPPPAAAPPVAGEQPWLAGDAQWLEEFAADPAPAAAVAPGTAVAPEPPAAEQGWTPVPAGSWFEAPADAVPAQRPGALGADTTALPVYSAVPAAPLDPAFAGTADEDTAALPERNESRGKRHKPSEPKEGGSRMRLLLLVLVAVLAAVGWFVVRPMLQTSSADTTPLPVPHRATVATPAATPAAAAKAVVPAPVATVVAPPATAAVAPKATTTPKAVATVAPKAATVAPVARPARDPFLPLVNAPAAGGATTATTG